MVEGQAVAVVTATDLKRLYEGELRREQLYNLRLSASTEQPGPRLARQRASSSVSAVGDEVERFEHQLADQDLAPGRSHDGLGSRGEVSDLDRDVGHGPLFAAIARVDDGSPSPVLEP